MSSFWVKKYLGQSRVGLLFTAGQKNVRFGSGPISSIQELTFPIKKRINTAVDGTFRLIIGLGTDGAVATWGGTKEGR